MDWILNNKEWLLALVGILITVIVGWKANGSNNKMSATSRDNSPITQINGSVDNTGNTMSARSGSNSPIIQKSGGIDR